MPRQLRVETAPAYDVSVGDGALSSLSSLLAHSEGVAVLTDANVAPLHLGRLPLPAGAATIEVPAGEGSKSLATVEFVLDQLVSAGLTRGSTLVALGGGVVGDLAGLCASLFLRGIAVVQCPTTLLSQVDSAIGGKTAVNLAGGKNLAGTFHQPRAVLADTATLATLSELEFSSGLGEVLKSALLAGEEDLSALEGSSGALVAREPAAIEDAVFRSMSLKARVVAADPLERDARRQLNLGHTFGHAIEHVAGFGAIPHGLAVAAGIGMALDEAERLGVLKDRQLPARVAELCQALELPVGLQGLNERFGLSLTSADLRPSMARDKKRVAGEVRLVLPVRAGQVTLDTPLSGS
jgi:3-dehydroquinate synthase